MPSNLPPEPWNPFLTALDAGLDRVIDLHCIGGFAVSLAYGSVRTTADIDILATIAPRLPEVLAPGLVNGELHQRFGLYIDWVTVVTPPENYEDRLTEMFAGAFNHIRLWVLEIHDLALCKLARNSLRDQDDVLWLARQPGFDPAILQQRYENELRPIVIGRPVAYDLTLKMWLEMIAEEQNRA